MTDGFIKTAAMAETPDDKRIYAIALAQVINNEDLTKEGRVQVHLPWLCGYDPWARVSSLMAGNDRGTYFIPQVGDEVLVAFNQGKVGETYVIGSLWNGQDAPPTKEAGAPVNVRMIRTPAGHEIKFDDKDGSIQIKNKNGGFIKLTSSEIELTITSEGNSASIKLEKKGAITLQTTGTLKIDAKKIEISASETLTLKGKQNAEVDGGQYCSINASKIDIGK